MEYKITPWSHFKALEFLIYGSILLSGLVYFLYMHEGYSTSLVQFFSLYYMLLLPTLFLHLEYYAMNKRSIIEINTLQRIISINEKQIISFDEIEKIILYMPPVWHRKGFIRLLPFEDYHYSKIKMKNGKQLVFTCLLAPKVEEAMKALSGIPLEKKKRLIASTLFE